jgi:hypothetical protein
MGNEGYRHLLFTRQSSRYPDELAQQVFVFNKVTVGVVSSAMIAIAGRWANPTDRGFVLNEPAIQVFEKKPKEPKETAVV